MRLFLFSLILLFVLTIVCGCSHEITPRRYSFADSEVPSLSVKNPIHITAHHNNKPAEKIFSYFVHSYYAKMDDLTDDAFATLFDTFNRKKVPMDEKAQKSMEISIIKAEGEAEAFTFNYKVILNVLLGNTVAKEFVGSQRTANHYTTNSTISDAITYAVFEMLKDDEVKKYLGGNNSNRLIELKELYDSGLITKEEFESKRSKILDSL